MGYVPPMSFFIGRNTATAVFLWVQPSSYGMIIPTIIEEEKLYYANYFMC